jgi:putative transposase
MLPQIQVCVCQIISTEVRHIISKVTQELSGMSEAARDAAMARYRVIQPYLEQNRSLVMVADDADVCFRTAQRWVSQYRKFGLVALAVV